MRSRSERQTHSDRPVENETHDTLRPQNPAEGAINPSRQTSAQRDEAISPNSPNRCPAGEGPTSNFNRRTEPRRRTSVNSVHSARAACEGPTSNSAVAAFPRERLLGQLVQQGSRTQVSMVGNLGESQTVQSLLPHPRPDVNTFGVQPPKSFTLVTENFNKSSHIPPATRGTGPPVTSPRVPA